MAGIRACRILVVCYGNICRSPFVAESLTHAVGSGVEVRSAGFHPQAGRSSPSRHVAMSREVGIDLTGHRSAVIRPTDIEWADLIVLMDRHNWQALQAAGARPERFVWLGALDGGPIEIADPYAMDERSARAVLQRLRRCSDELVSLLRPTRGDGATA